MEDFSEREDRALLVMLQEFPDSFVKITEAIEHLKRMHGSMTAIEKDGYKILRVRLLGLDDEGEGSKSLKRTRSSRRNDGSGSNKETNEGKSEEKNVDNNDGHNTHLDHLSPALGTENEAKLEPNRRKNEEQDKMDEKGDGGQREMEREALEKETNEKGKAILRTISKSGKEAVSSTFESGSPKVHGSDRFIPTLRRQSSGDSFDKARSMAMPLGKRRNIVIGTSGIKKGLILRESIETDGNSREGGDSSLNPINPNDKPRIQSFPDQKTSLGNQVNAFQSENDEWHGKNVANDSYDDDKTDDENGDDITVKNHQIANGNIHEPNFNMKATQSERNQGGNEATLQHAYNIINGPILALAATNNADNLQRELDADSFQAQGIQTWSCDEVLLNSNLNPNGETNSQCENTPNDSGSIPSQPQDFIQPSTANLLPSPTQSNSRIETSEQLRPFNSENEPNLTTISTNSRNISEIYSFGNLASPADEDDKHGFDGEESIEVEDSDYLPDSNKLTDSKLDDKGKGEIMTGNNDFERNECIHSKDQYPVNEKKKPKPVNSKIKKRMSDDVDRIYGECNNFDGDHSKRRVRKMKTKVKDPNRFDSEQNIAQNAIGNDCIASTSTSVPNAVTITEIRGETNPLDVSNGFENLAIPIVNEINDDKIPYFHYMTKNHIYDRASINFSFSRLSDEEYCTSCTKDCLANVHPCICTSRSLGEYAYATKGVLTPFFLNRVLSEKKITPKFITYCKGICFMYGRADGITNFRKCSGHVNRTFIKECFFCSCDAGCGNRIVQKGINIPLQVFYTPEGKGWGLRCTETLPPGKFVCEYIGFILTNNELHERNNQAGKIRRHFYPVILDADLVHEELMNDDEALCLDATDAGNVARFINHRCGDSNLVDIPVQFDTPDRHYYHLAFFTKCQVQAGEELTWDYGIDFDDENHPVAAFVCKCGSSLCRGHDKRMSS